MSAPQAAAITACTACAAVGGAAAGGAFSSSTNLDADTREEEHNHKGEAKTPSETKLPEVETPTPWFSVADEKSENKSDFTADNKIGKTYEKYLVGSFGDTNKSNEAWWKKSFKKYQEDQAVSSGKRNFSSLFESGKVSEGFKPKTEADSTDPKPLNKVCLEVYKKEKTEIDPGSEGATSDKAKLRDDLWRYCSPLGTRPETVNDQTSGETYDSAKIGGTKKTVLLATKEGVNDVLWSIKQKEFFSLNAVSDSLFSTLFKEKETKKDVKDTLRNKCKELYASETNNGDQLIKYCTLLGKEN